VQLLTQLWALLSLHALLAPTAPNVKTDLNRTRAVEPPEIHRPGPSANKTLRQEPHATGQTAQQGLPASHAGVDCSRRRE